MQLIYIIQNEYKNFSLWYLTSFILGIIYYFSLKFEPSDVFFISFVGIIFCLAFIVNNIPNNVYKILVILAIAFILGILVGKIKSYFINTVQLKTKLETVVTGKISSIKSHPKGFQVILQDLTFDSKIDPSNIPIKIRINIKSDYMQDIIIGDIIKAKVMLMPPMRSIIPTGYDFGFYAYFSGIGATGFVYSKIIKLESNNSYSINNLRYKILHHIIDVMGRQNGNFLGALIIGESSGIPKDILENMRLAGLAHILCVSGLHLSLVAGIIFVATRVVLNFSNNIAWNYNIKNIAAIAAIFGSGLYLMLSGMQIAATRAYIMTSIFMLSIILNKILFPIRSLVIAAFLILLFNPEYVLYPSFQLSFIAVLALISGYEFYIKNKHLFGPGGGVMHQIRMGIISNIYTSITASSATIPIVIFHFYNISLYTILSNLIIVPIISIIVMPLSVLSLILMPLNLDYYVLSIISHFISFIINTASIIRHLPYSVYYFGHISSAILTVYIVGFFWFVSWNSKIKFAGLFVIFISILCMFHTKNPDIIFDPQNQILGIKSHDETLTLYGNKISEFSLDYISHWFGINKAYHKKLDIKNKIYKIRTIYGNILCINNSIHKLLDSHCSYVLNREDFMETTPVLVYCSRKQCDLVYDDYSKLRFQ